MIVLCYGVTKSGSTLAFELAKRALANCGHSQDRLSDEAIPSGHKINFIDSISPEIIAQLDKEIGPKRMVAIKTHTGLDRESFLHLDKLSAAGRIKVQAVYRDPRDICLSMIDAGKSARAAGQSAFSEIHDMADAIQAVERQLGKLRRWGALTNVLLISYDSAAFDTEKALIAIDKQLGISSNHKVVIDEVMNEAFTQRNKAVRARHRQELSASERKIMDIVFGGFLKRVCVQQDYSWFTDARRMIQRRSDRVKETTNGAGAPGAMKS